MPRAAALALALGLAPAALGAEEPPAGPLAFTGTIGGRNVFHLVLERDGERVRGSYFQVRVGRGIAIAGRLEPARLQLATFDGRETFDAAPKGRAWEGSWTQGGDALPLRLLPTAPRPLPPALRCEAQHLPKGAPAAVVQLELELGGGELKRFAIDSFEPGRGRGCADATGRGVGVALEPLTHGLRLGLRAEDSYPRVCEFELLRLGEFVLVRNRAADGCHCGARMRGHFAVLGSVRTQRCTVYDLR